MLETVSATLVSVAVLPPRRLTPTSSAPSEPHISGIKLIQFLRWHSLVSCVVKTQVTDISVRAIAGRDMPCASGAELDVLDCLLCRVQSRAVTTTW
jgi:hypothetical protein